MLTVAAGANSTMPLVPLSVYPDQADHERLNPRQKRSNATEAKLRSRLQLPLLGSNQDSPDPEGQ
jgi:hypothetical protein